MCLLKIVTHINSVFNCYFQLIFNFEGFRSSKEKKDLYMKKRPVLTHGHSVIVNNRLWVRFAHSRTWWQSAALSSAIQHCLKIGEWGTEYLNTTFPLPTLRACNNTAWAYKNKKKSFFAVRPFVCPFVKTREHVEEICSCWCKYPGLQFLGTPLF